MQRAEWGRWQSGPKQTKQNKTKGIETKNVREGERKKEMKKLIGARVCLHYEGEKYI